MFILDSRPPWPETSSPCRHSASRLGGDLHLVERAPQPYPSFLCCGFGAGEEAGAKGMPLRMCEEILRKIICVGKKNESNDDGVDPVPIRCISSPLP